MSRWADVIKFITVGQTQDEDGFPIQGEVIGPAIFANRKSVRSSEHYQAAQNGIKLEAVFEVRVSDYTDEQVLIWNQKKYKIERTYEKTDIIELVCRLFDGAVV
ncbi:phage head closure protein [Bacillus sp. Hm123]|uniref:phage head closure protein n=1 Tax=Bacillus sp. Hm123 TaxID=3450745 RepID=UPI003F41EBFF